FRPCGSHEVFIISAAKTRVDVVRRRNPITSIQAFRIEIVASDCLLANFDADGLTNCPWAVRPPPGGGLRKNAPCWRLRCQPSAIAGVPRIAAGDAWDRLSRSH